MKPEDLLDSVGSIEPRIVRASEVSGKRRSVMKPGIAAVLAVMVLCAVILIPGIFQKGTQDSVIDEPVPFELDGRLYQILEEPSQWTRYGLPEILSGEHAGGHRAWLNHGEEDFYTISETETETEMLEYAPCVCPAVYIVRENGSYKAAVFCNDIHKQSNFSAPMVQLFETWGIYTPAEINEIAETDWNRNRISGAVVEDSGALKEFYHLALDLDPYGNDDFQAEVFGGIDEAEQGAAHNAFADDLHMIRVRTSSGLCFYMDVHPSYGWIYGPGTMTYYRMNSGMAAWIANHLKRQSS
jgi:hypothetical protein